MIEWLRFGISAAFILGGVFFIFCGIFGVFRFDFVLNRIHSSAICDTLGLSLVLVGLIIFQGLGWNSFKLFLVILFLWFTSPISGHLIGKLEYATNENLAAHCSLPEEKNGEDSE